MKAPIINADDFGLNSSVNQAIIEAFDKGWINSTTLMANMPGFEEAVELTHQMNLQNKVGVHLVLTVGESLTPAIMRVPFLFKKEKPLKKLFFLNSYERQLIFDEFAAQIERVKSKGIPITHLDTHHQIHDVWAISQILLKLLRVYRIPRMRILNNLENSNWYKNLYRRAVNKYLSIQGANHSDYFGSSLDYLEKLKQAPTFISQKTVEIMVHPAYNHAGELVDKLGGKSYRLNFRENRMDNIANQ